VKSEKSAIFPGKQFSWIPKNLVLLAFYADFADSVMKRFVIPSSLVLFIALSVSGCQGYPEGPEISFRSKISRVINKWKAEYVTENGKDRTYNYDSLYWEFLDDGNIEVSTILADSTLFQEGLWDLIDEGKTLRVLYTDPAIWPDRTYFEVLRLKETEMWLKDDRDSIVIEYRLIPA
jgi:hypothetical protein